MALKAIRKGHAAAFEYPVGMLLLAIHEINEAEEEEGRRHLLNTAVGSRAGQSAKASDFKKFVETVTKGR